MKYKLLIAAAIVLVFTSCEPSRGIIECDTAVSGDEVCITFRINNNPDLSTLMSADDYAMYMALMAQLEEDGIKPELLAQVYSDTIENYFFIEWSEWE